jgi:hypothetical protein
MKSYEDSSGFPCARIDPSMYSFGWCFIFYSLEIFKSTSCFGPTGHLQVYNLVCGRVKDLHLPRVLSRNGGAGAASLKYLQSETKLYA